MAFFYRQPFYKVVYPSINPTKYIKEHDEIVSSFETQKKDYYFYEDTPRSRAYKDLYVTGDVSLEIVILSPLLLFVSVWIKLNRPRLVILG